MSKKIALYILLIIILVGGGWYLMKREGWGLRSKPSITPYYTSESVKQKIVQEVMAAHIYIPGGAKITEVNSYSRTFNGETTRFVNVTYTIKEGYASVASSYRKQLPSNGFFIFSDKQSDSIERIIATKSPLSVSIDLSKGNASSTQVRMIMQNL